MPGAAHHALLDVPGVRTHFEHLDIVIGFEHDGIAIAQMVFHKFGHVAEIGDHGHLDATRAKREAQRIGGIVRNRKGRDFNIANAERAARLNEIDTREPLGMRLGKQCATSPRAWRG